MQVRVIEPFKIRGKLMTPGTVLNIPDGALTRLAGRVVPTEPASIEVMEAEYFTLLARYWTIDSDPTATMDEVRELVNRLDELFQALHRQGRKVPVRLPIERQRKVA